MSNTVIINMVLIFNWIFINFCKSMHIAMIPCIGFVPYHMNEQQNNFEEFYWPIDTMYDQTQMLCDLTVKNKSIFYVDIMYFKWLYNIAFMSLILAPIYLLLLSCIKYIIKQIIKSNQK
eukprot:UN04404